MDTNRVKSNQSKWDNLENMAWKRKATRAALNNVDVSIVGSERTLSNHEYESTDIPESNEASLMNEELPQSSKLEIFMCDSFYDERDCTRSDKSNMLEESFFRNIPPQHETASQFYLHLDEESSERCHLKKETDQTCIENSQLDPNVPAFIPVSTAPKRRPGICLNRKRNENVQYTDKPESIPTYNIFAERTKQDMIQDINKILTKLDMDRVKNSNLNSVEEMHATTATSVNIELDVKAKDVRPPLSIPAIPTAMVLPSISTFPKDFIQGYDSQMPASSGLVVPESMPLYSCGGGEMSGFSELSFHHEQANACPISSNVKSNQMIQSTEMSLHNQNAAIYSMAEDENQITVPGSQPIFASMTPQQNRSSERTVLREQISGDSRLPNYQSNANSMTEEHFTSGPTHLPSEFHLALPQEAMPSTAMIREHLAKNVLSHPELQLPISRSYNVSTGQESNAATTVIPADNQLPNSQFYAVNNQNLSIEVSTEQSSESKFSSTYSSANNPVLQFGSTAGITSLITKEIFRNRMNPQLSLPFSSNFSPKHNSCLGNQASVNPGHEHFWTPSVSAANHLPIPQSNAHLITDNQTPRMEIPSQHMRPQGVTFQQQVSPSMQEYKCPQSLSSCTSTNSTMHEYNNLSTSLLSNGNQFSTGVQIVPERGQCFGNTSSRQRISKVPEYNHSQLPVFQASPSSTIQEHHDSSRTLNSQFQNLQLDAYSLTNNLVSRVHSPSERSQHSGGERHLFKQQLPASEAHASMMVTLQQEPRSTGWPPHHQRSTSPMYHVEEKQPTISFPASVSQPNISGEVQEQLYNVRNKSAPNTNFIIKERSSADIPSLSPRLPVAESECQQSMPPKRIQSKMGGFLNENNANECSRSRFLTGDEDNQIGYFGPQPYFQFDRYATPSRGILKSPKAELTEEDIGFSFPTTLPKPGTKDYTSKRVTFEKPVE